MKFGVTRLADLTHEERAGIMHRSEAIVDELIGDVEKIIEAVREKSDAALIDFTANFDGVDLKSKGIRVKDEEFARAEELLNQQMRTSIAAAIENVTEFHKLQRPEGITLKEVSPGIYAGERATPISSAGLYVPRGKGSFPSMLYMLAVPARLAGVSRVCVVTPPNKDGSVDPACLYAAKLCKIDEVYRIGGAQAVAALACGTDTIQPVDKIVGPGSPYVAAAKRLLAGIVDTGLPAGPSESIIIADGAADPWKVALDLLIEAEHGPDSAALVVTDSFELAESVHQTVTGLVEELPEPRKGFVTTVLSSFGGIIVSKSMREACAFVNDYAPEHLQIQTADPWETLSYITDAGEILLGENTPFSVANYAAGPNAVLPTGGKARTWSPVSVRDFLKYSSIVYSTESGLQRISSTVVQLAEYEGFPAHAQALTRRNDRKRHGL